MAKKEKVPIQRDKRMEPIDNELDAAMGLLDNANKQITDLLASFTPEEATAQSTEAAVPAAELDDAASVPETPSDAPAAAETPQAEAKSAENSEPA